MANEFWTATLRDLDAAVIALGKAGYELDYELGDEDELVAEIAGLQRAVRLFRRKCEDCMRASEVAEGFFCPTAVRHCVMSARQ